MSFARRRSLNDMKLLLTSAGIKNPTIQNTLIELLGKPIADSNAVCIPPATDGPPGAVDLSVVPTPADPARPKHTMAAAARWAAELSGPAYAIDDDTAIKVVDGNVDVVSEGKWKRLA